MSEFTVKKISKARAKHWIEQKHYRKTLGIFWEGFALIENGMVAGVVCYGQPSAPIQRYAFDERDFRLYELTRLVVQTKSQNAASYLIANSLKMLSQRPSAVISYADSSMGHVGIVYQATNWLYTGAVKAHDKFYVVDGEKLHPTTVRDRYGVTSPTKWAKENGIEMVPAEDKHRYFMLLGAKRDKARMLKTLRYPAVAEYPKGAKTMYDTGPKLEDLFDE